MDKADLLNLMAKNAPSLAIGEANKLADAILGEIAFAGSQVTKPVSREVALKSYAKHYPTWQAMEIAKESPNSAAAYIVNTFNYGNYRTPQHIARQYIDWYVSHPDPMFW